MNTYQRKKEAARQRAITWQLKYSATDFSYTELAVIGEHFHNVGKRFGLLREFRENAIPC